MQQRNAFTLVELLVVIAIISMLAALLLPSIENAVAQSRLTVCAGQLRQQYVGIASYTTASHDWMPCRSYNMFGKNRIWDAGAQFYFVNYAREELGIEFGANSPTDCVPKERYNTILHCPAAYIPDDEAYYLTSTIGIHTSYLYFGFSEHSTGLKLLSNGFARLSAQMENTKKTGYAGQPKILIGDTFSYRTIPTPHKPGNIAHYMCHDGYGGNFLYPNGGVRLFGAQDLARLSASDNWVPRGHAIFSGLFNDVWHAAFEYWSPGTESFIRSMNEPQEIR